MSRLAAATSSRSLRCRHLGTPFEMRGVLERTAAHLSANGLTHDRKLDPLRRLRDGLDAILVPAIDSFARYLDLNEAFDSNAGRPRQESHVRWMINVRWMIKWVLAPPFAAPGVFGAGRLQALRGRRGGGRRGAWTAPGHGGSHREASENPRRKPRPGSTPSRAATLSRSRGLIRSQAACRAPRG
jgi:hypothetical protein